MVKKKKDRVKCPGCGTLLNSELTDLGSWICPHCDYLHVSGKEAKK